MSDKVLALVRYYAREGYSRQLQTVCNEVLKKRANDPLLVFWRCYGMLMEGSSAEALRELRAVSAVPDLELAAAAAMLQAHESAKVVDQDAVMELQTKLEVEESTASDAAALHLASFYSLTKSKERARGLAERVLRMQPDNGQALVLLGWVILGQHADEEYGALVDDSELEEAAASFEAALAADPNDLEAMLGRSKVAEVRHNLSGALEGLTEVAVRFSWFMPALVEKARLLLAVGDWEQANDTIHSILSVDPQNIMALAWQALHAITREGNNKSAVKLLQDLFAAVNRAEPRNAELYLRLAKPLGRAAGSDTTLLTVTSMMAERAVQLRPDHAPYLVEAGYQKLFLEEWGSAAEKFTAALAVDELSLDASAGALEASIQLGELEEASGQVMFLQEMYASQANLQAARNRSDDDGAQAEPSTLLYLKGLLAWKQGNAQEGLTFLERALMAQFQAASTTPLSLEMYVALWPGRVLSVVRLLLTGVGGEPRAPTEAPSPLIAKCTRALDLLNKHAPALVEAALLSARALYLNGSLDAALRKAQDILRANPEEYTVHLLITSIYVHQEKAQAALAALDQAVSSNFAVREMPLFHVVNAQVLMASGKLEEARKVLESAMNLPGMRTALTPQQRARLGRRVVEPTLHERATTYLLLADCLGRLSKLPDAPEAKKYINDAIREFEGTSEEVRVTIADGELAIARGDVEGALKKLRKIPNTSPHFTRARMAMADILLRHRKDKAGYVKCYMELVEASPDYDSYCMLGEAFMQIQEPEKAVRAFEAALEFSPKDTELTTRIARALVTTHDYQHAIDYFNKAIFANRGNFSLQLELANLLVRLRQWQPAVAVLNKCLERPRDPSGGGANSGQGVESLTIDVEAWLAMARVYQGSGDMENYVEALARALDLQKGVLQRMRGEVPEALQAARDKAAQICYDLAEHNKKLRKFDQAMEFYSEALRNCDTHSKSMMAAAKLHLANGNVDACQQMCVTLLKHDPQNEEASIMLAELMFHKEHYDTAIYHFQQLLERAPSHWGALSQLISLLRRAGRLEDVPRYFTAAETASPKSAMEPGYYYCKGLYHRYINEPREALKAFNFARKDTKWGGPATLHMVEIYLNPDNDAVWAERGAQDTQESREAVGTARSLLSQMRPQDTNSQRYQVLEAYARMAGKEPQQIDAALNTLLDMANQDPNNVPVLLAMATGFMLMDQVPKARNQLKRVQKIAYKPDEADEFERAWLLLADIHIQGGKFDLAQDLCQKCLKYNKSCAKAWEHMGAIMEREQAYKDAAEHYEKAWKHENQASAAVGFKLAFNYLKAKRFVEAIDVCHKVIKAFPDYPKIKKEVLEKARQGLKP
uniref:Tetratricopeptide repeat-like domain-containing protein n=1 Tax=Chlamydomonas leiostraca TaxID=1034604 RepID=A0A7S0S5T6_9CHLO|mmetsp:Transcript_9322/g.23083  ORF Transcript_9322/g.23083 Transcript_9322/m.23083 type:complete len:1346 (+) Transcript_9322:90-4127(+)